MNQSKIETNAVWEFGSYRMYEEFIFAYTLILVGFLYLGMQTFGFEISSFSPAENLAINFVWYLVIATGMYFTPFLHRYFFHKHGKNRQQKIQEKINTIEDLQTREELQNYYVVNGRLPPNRRQIWALIILFWILLFELFFIHAWVKGEDHHLVWQPFWVDAIWQWMSGHVNFPPLNIDRDIFMIDMENTIFAGSYINEQALLNTPLAKSGFIFHFWRILTFIPILLCLYIILVQAIDWLGMTKINPANIHGVGEFIWSSLATFVLLLITLGILSTLSLILEFSMPTVLGNSIWLNKIGFYMMMFVNILLFLKLVYGWGIFWKHVWLNFFGSLNKGDSNVK